MQQQKQGLESRINVLVDAQKQAATDAAAQLQVCCCIPLKPCLQAVGVDPSIVLLFGSTFTASTFDRSWVTLMPSIPPGPLLIIVVFNLFASCALITPTNHVVVSCLVGCCQHPLTLVQMMCLSSLNMHLHDRMPS